MKVILIDDESVMHLIMRKMLEKYNGLQVAGAFTDTHAASAFLSANPDIELAFVDITMPGGSGLAFAAMLEETGSRTQIVFVTSHKDFAVEAFELSALDYLVKPVTPERLERTIQRAFESRSGLQRSPHAADQAVEHGGLARGRTSIAALGDFFVRGEAGRVKWMSSKSAELFAYLLLCRGRRVQRARLIADIFAGMTNVNAEKYLNTAVYQLRKSLEPIGLREAVRSENDGYALELGDALIDYEAFEQQLGRLGSLTRTNMEEALEVERLYTGDLFGSKAYVWAIHETNRLAERYVGFVKRLAEALLAEGKTEACAKLANKLHMRNPLDDSVVAILMKAYAQEGDKKSITAQYTDYVKLLKQELGIRPTKELLLLYDSLISGLQVERS